MLWETFAERPRMGIVKRGRGAPKQGKVGQSGHRRERGQNHNVCARAHAHLRGALCIPCDVSERHLALLCTLGCCAPSAAVQERCSCARCEQAACERPEGGGKQGPPSRVVDGDASLRFLHIDDAEGGEVEGDAVDGQVGWVLGGGCRHQLAHLAGQEHMDTSLSVMERVEHLTGTPVTQNSVLKGGYG